MYQRYCRPLNCQQPIFRLAGIYGPHRNVFQRITTGNTQVIDESKIKFSRIHVEDIVKILFASMLIITIRENQLSKDIVKKSDINNL